MASNLTIVSGNAAPRAFGGQAAGHQDAPSQAGGLLGIFGALLNKDAPAAPVEDKVTSSQPASGTDIDLAALLAGIGEGLTDGGDDDQGPETLLDALGMPIAQAVPADSRPMLDFIDAMGALKAGLDAGSPLDPDLLAQIEAALSDLAGALGLDLDALPVPTDFAALLAGNDAEGKGLAATLTGLLTPVASSIADANIQGAADLSALENQLKSLGDKMGALLAAIQDGEVSAEKLAGIGMPVDGEPSADIAEAMSRFMAAAKAEALVPDAPELATPALKLTEPVLTGKTADSADQAEPTSRAAKPAEASAENSGADRDASDDRPARERPEAMRAERPAPVNTNAAPAAETSPAAANAVGPNAAQLRVDAVANPRVIQAGYQTSQQQLNLPQIAFELARQVQDGNTRFQIRLDPPELGRIDVRLDIDKAGQVNARLVVEKAETLDLMQRDQRGLERALQQAGIDAGKTNLEFSLKQNPFSGQFGQGERQDGGANGNGDAGAGTAEAEPLPTVNLYRGSLQASGVNIIA